MILTIFLIQINEKKTKTKIHAPFFSQSRSKKKLKPRSMPFFLPKSSKKHQIHAGFLTEIKPKKI